MRVRKCRGYLLIMLGILLILILAPMSVHAAESNGSSINDWEYTDNGDGSITLTKYKGTSKDIVIPGRMNVNGEQRQVKIKSFIDAGIGQVSDKDSLVVGTSEEMVIYDDTSLERAFYWNNYKSIDLSGLDTSKVTNMKEMFAQSTGVTHGRLEHLDVSNFNTSKVKNMNSMFAGCWNVGKIDVSSFNTSNVKDMKNMFAFWTRLQELDLHNFDTSNVTDMQAMISQCFSLSKVDVSSFNTAQVENMEYMFSNDYSLTKLDLSNFDTSKVMNMHGMFAYDDKLVEVDLSNARTSKGVNTDDFFVGCNELKLIDLSSMNCFTNSVGEYFPLGSFYTTAGKDIPTVIITRSADVKNCSPDGGKNIGNERIPYTATVKLDANGGTFADKAAATEKTITLGGNIFYDTADVYKEEFTVTNDNIAKRIDNPVKEGLYFNGWYLDKECTKPLESKALTIGDDNEVTLYAGYGEKKPEIVDPGTDKPAGDNKEDNTGNPAQKVIHAVQTGDISSPYFWAAVAIVALIGVAATVLIRRRGIRSH